MRDYLWRQRVKVESTLAMSMLEPWEKLLCVIIATLFALLLMTGIYQYLPQHVSVMQKRAIYYLFGQEGEDSVLRQLVVDSRPEL
ncbi:hypothetical protein CONPUDRAFT_119658 [Coniophora puteana RWD-64-598 SS2]|uniref:Uncharacterized protein n=1 Tax=Coniophora puteana (strain RWD-64-598) TaxID=741705 RepID=A0A5M3MY41_CONPW|nr:uncharacterized protein CONPUDRAFT_119658 [Coniophora puteana RWD-64-598 SS2]EIW84083.1 hypothetical protein CONPUDRAFT_119658 [Coniophora puteana RWD-64-598 SS2]